MFYEVERVENNFLSFSLENQNGCHRAVNPVCQEEICMKLNLSWLTRILLLGAIWVCAFKSYRDVLPWKDMKVEPDGKPA